MFRAFCVLEIFASLGLVYFGWAVKTAPDIDMAVAVIAHAFILIGGCGAVVFTSLAYRGYR